MQPPCLHKSASHFCPLPTKREARLQKLCLDTLSTLWLTPAVLNLTHDLVAPLSRLQGLHVSQTHAHGPFLSRARQLPCRGLLCITKQLPRVAGLGARCCTKRQPMTSKHSATCGGPALGPLPRARRQSHQFQQLRPPCCVLVCWFPHPLRVMHQHQRHCLPRLVWSPVQPLG